MERMTGTKAVGVRLPIVKQGDDLAAVVVDSLRKAVDANEIQLKNDDIIAVTESVLARCQGNFVRLDTVTEELLQKYKKSIGVLFPVLSRNRFAMVLRAVIATRLPVTLVLTYPTDEVGNALMHVDTLVEHGINPYTDVFDEQAYREMIGEEFRHPFTGLDYVSLYKDMAVDDNVSIYFSNDPLAILRHTDEVLIANIHDRHRLKDKLLAHGARTVHALDEICTTPVRDCGYNPDFGLLGSNMSSSDSLKLFPRDSEGFATELQQKIQDAFAIHAEVMVYGDGAFKDPVGKIWELADPVVSPGYTAGLEGVPNELKLKYLADNNLSHLSGEEAEAAMREMIRSKKIDLTGQNESLGTTPRHLTDLLGSLADLVSGSGDKGTPVVCIQGYFDNYASE